MLGNDKQISMHEDGTEYQYTVDRVIFVDDLFRRKLNMWNILHNVRRSIPILVAKVWRRNLDYVKIYKRSILLTKISWSTVGCMAFMGTLGIVHVTPLVSVACYGIAYLTWCEMSQFFAHDYIVSTLCHVP